MTIEQIKNLLGLLSEEPKPATTVVGAHPFWRIGAKYFIRTVTHHYTGQLVALTDTELIVESAAWIADDGRFADALKSGEFSEVEPYPAGKVLIGRGAILDAVELSTIPISQK